MDLTTQLDRLVVQLGLQLLVLLHLRNGLHEVLINPVLPLGPDRKEPGLSADIPRASTLEPTGELDGGVELGRVTAAADRRATLPVGHHEGAAVKEELPLTACHGSLSVPEVNQFGTTDHKLRNRQTQPHEANSFLLKPFNIFSSFMCKRFNCQLQYSLKEPDNSKLSHAMDPYVPKLERRALPFQTGALVNLYIDTTLPDTGQTQGAGSPIVFTAQTFVPQAIYCVRVIPCERNFSVKKLQLRQNGLSTDEAVQDVESLELGEVSRSWQGVEGAEADSSIL